MYTIPANDMEWFYADFDMAKFDFLMSIGGQFYKALQTIWLVTRGKPGIAGL